MKNLLQDNLEGNVTFKKIFVTYYARIVYRTLIPKTSLMQRILLKILS